jgi:hypothetical protein
MPMFLTRFLGPYIGGPTAFIFLKPPKKGLNFALDRFRLG